MPGTHGREAFVVNNYEGSYAGVRTLTPATTYSDNAVYAAVGIKVGTKRVAKLAKRMGIRTPVSHNYAMTLGGLRHGVTALDMAHAYETFARGGKRVAGTLGAGDRGPVGILQVRRGDKVLDTNKVKTKRIIPSNVADEVTAILHTVVTSGTGTHAQLSDTEDLVAGKTGTTENYGDAWFVGYTPRYTTAVWVGYPDRLKPMQTEYNGGPVAGGTYPADIWHDIMTQVYAIDTQRENARRQREIEKLQREGKDIPPELQQTVPTTTTPSVPVTPSTPTPHHRADGHHGRAPAPGRRARPAAAAGHPGRRHHRRRRAARAPPAEAADDGPDPAGHAGRPVDPGHRRTRDRRRHAAGGRRRRTPGLTFSRRAPPPAARAATASTRSARRPRRTATADRRPW